MSSFAPIGPVAPIETPPLSALFPTDEVSSARLSPQKAASGFGALFADQVAQVNQQLLTSQSDLQALATGDVQNLHRVMIRLEESRLSFQLMMQVRGRLLEAYQDIMKMQI